MFERRVRIVLVFLVVVALALLLRAAQVQVAQAGHWKAIASQTMRRTELTETTRGRILDVKGRVLAVDMPCNDAAVAYWFITQEPDEQRLYSEVARKLARQQTPGYASLSREEQHKLVLSFMPQARLKLEEMWDTLAGVGGVSRAEIDARRREIVNRVTRRREDVVQKRYKKSLKEHEGQGASPWWRRWLLGEADAPPEMEAFEEPIAEELQAHVVLPNISTEAYNELRKRLEELPGLRLPASQTRSYPAGAVAAHVVGLLAPVKPEDLRSNPEPGNERRAYLGGDLIGLSGLELLGEPRLRGIRGRLDLDLETEEAAVAFEKVPGQDLQTTIDLDLQARMRDAFQNVTFEWPDKAKETGPMPGAVVAIEVKTGAILALVSNPDFDLNNYEQDYPRLSHDYINRPLMNRATSFATVPGSTVKPIVGLAAVTEGVLKPHETIECDGYMYFDGKPYLGGLRCWTASMFGDALKHHAGTHAHPTPHLNPGFDPPPGHLTLADAIQRSCNVFFQVLAMRLGEPRLTEWMVSFGLGSTTGSGLPEQRGLILKDLAPDVRNSPSALQGKLLLAATGQGHVQATPLQMANVAATLSRGGVVIRPTLVTEDTRRAVEEKRDLKVDLQAMNMVRRGMEAAVRTGGSGSSIDGSVDVAIAVKTGSAQSHALTIPKHGSDGKLVYDSKGAVVRTPVELSTRDMPNPDATWYRRVNSTSDSNARQSHAWVIGYAPADNPKVAFAVFVEYGGSGGASAASVVTQLIDALVDLGYLTPTKPPKPNA